MKTVIKNRYTEKVIVESELTLIKTVEENDANLCEANLCGANLCGANLCGADLCGANLCDANLCDADLRARAGEERGWLVEIINDPQYGIRAVTNVEADALRSNSVRPLVGNSGDNVCTK